jgi:hypothetical protein
VRRGLLSANQGQHRTGTSPSSTAAGIGDGQFGGDRLIDRQSIGDEQIVARHHVPECFDENSPPLVLDCLTVRLAGLIQSAGAVAANTAVNHSAVTSIGEATQLRPPDSSAIVHQTVARMPSRHPARGFAILVAQLSCSRGETMFNAMNRFQVIRGD